MQARIGVLLFLDALLLRPMLSLRKHRLVSASNERSPVQKISCIEFRWRSNSDRVTRSNRTGRLTLFSSSGMTLPERNSEDSQNVPTIGHEHLDAKAEFYAVVKLREEVLCPERRRQAGRVRLCSVAAPDDVGYCFALCNVRLWHLMDAAIVRRKVGLFDRKTAHCKNPCLTIWRTVRRSPEAGRDEDLRMFGFGTKPSFWLAHLKSSKANNVSPTELVTNPTEQRSDLASKRLAAKAK